MINSTKSLGPILLTNDDGYDAHRLELLRQIASSMSDEIWVVAPERDQSGKGHSISIHEPLRVKRHGERFFSVTGTPADCVTVALQHIMKGTKPDLILSGINRGSNLGVETVFSGTVGAAMTGAIHGHRSIALSQVMTSRRSESWGCAAEHGRSVINWLAEQDWGRCLCMNVNFPSCFPEAVRGRAITRQGRGSMDCFTIEARADRRDLEYLWLYYKHVSRTEKDDTESAAIAAGHISITPLEPEHTDEVSRAHLRL